MADITPRPHVLLALARQNLHWWEALAELIDNSFDAGASRVVVAYDKKARTLTVEDDGCGVRDVLSLVTLGYHHKHQIDGLGMYGIGAKDAWLWIGGKLHIDTICNGYRTVLSVDAEKLTSSPDGRWECDAPTVEPCTLPSRTILRMPLYPQRNQPSDAAFESIAFRFTPALRSGRQIVVVSRGERMPLSPCSLPPLQDSVRSEFEIDGKRVAIDIGIVPDGYKMQNGPLWIQYGHRIIKSDSTIGCGSYSVGMKIGGIVQLHKSEKKSDRDGWELSKNKNDFSKHLDRLEDAIFCRIEHVLSKASQLAESIETSQLKSEIEGVLNDALTKRREKRGKGESKGTVAPKHTERQRTTARQVHADQPGNATQAGDGNRRRGFVLDWCDEDSGRIGKFEGIGSHVMLNIQHPFIAAARAKQNRIALLSAAWALIADYAVRHRGENKLLSFEWEDFSQAFSHLAMAYKEGGDDANKQAAS